jgi:hypothetical protein
MTRTELATLDDQLAAANNDAPSDPLKLLSASADHPRRA